MQKLALFCLALVASARPAQAAPVDPIDRIVFAEMQRQRSPSMGVAVVRNGIVVKQMGYGIANLEQRSAASATTVYQTASVGKQFTAALVLLLVREGKLALDEPVTTYLPEAPSAWERITVRHLLNHTAGVARIDPATDLRKDYTEAELLASAYKSALKSAPGEKHEYSNLGYQVLGFLCSRVGAKFWADQMRERIFAPLGMTSRVISEHEITPKRAAGYERVQGRFGNQTWVAASQNTTADGSLYVSAGDMARWALALQNNQILTKAEQETMWRPARLNSGEQVPYGFGWGVFNDAGHRAVCHAGNWQGFTAYLCHLPEDRLTISVLMNRAHGQAHVVADRIAAHYVSVLQTPTKPAPSTKTLMSGPLFLRGSMNGWKADTPFAKTAPNLLEARTVLPAGIAEFKIADAEWQFADLGVFFDEDLVQVGQVRTLAYRAENAVLEVQTPGEYIFRLRLPAKGPPTITVAPAKATTP